MDIGIANIAIAVGAGLASVLSPCVLPVVPVIVAGADRKDRLRPLLVVAGLSITFILMGVVMSIMGSMLVGRMRAVEQAGGAFIALLGVLVAIDVNVFKRLHFLSNIQVRAEGRIGGLLLGMALGIVWIPCIGPILSIILTMVGTSGDMAKGVLFLGFYSLGFALPMLAVGYFSHAVQRRLQALYKHGPVLRYATGGILMAFGLYIVFKGNFAF